MKTKLTSRSTISNLAANKRELLDAIAELKQASDPPQVPELPPGFEIEFDQEKKEWWISNSDRLFDGLDEYPADRSRTVELAWELFLDDVSVTWRKFFSHHRSRG